MVWYAPIFCISTIRYSGSVPDIEDMDWRAFKQHAADRALPPRLPRRAFHDVLEVRAKTRMSPRRGKTHRLSDDQDIAWSASHSRAADSTSVSSTRLQIERRAADDLEHVGGGGLLLQRFAQLVEQARVLDRDDGLVGEVFDQFDLLVGEWPDLLSIDCDRADQLSSLSIGTQNIGPRTA